jgi:hypothetical protein
MSLLATFSTDSKSASISAYLIKGSKTKRLSLVFTLYNLHVPFLPSGKMQGLGISVPDPNPDPDPPDPHVFRPS